MKISKKVLDIIDNPITRTRIAMALKQGEQSVALMCRKNVDNGPLTKTASINVIREVTGLTDDEIFTEEIETKGGKKNGQQRKITLESRKNTVIQ